MTRETYFRVWGIINSFLAALCWVGILLNVALWFTADYLRR